MPEVLIAARAMNAGVAILKPYLTEAGVEAKGTAVIGTVKGDLHDIGKNLVKMMLEGRGLNVIDLGVDVEPERFVQAAIEQRGGHHLLLRPADHHHGRNEARGGSRRGQRYPR